MFWCTRCASQNAQFHPKGTTQRWAHKAGGGIKRHDSIRRGVGGLEETGATLQPEIAEEVLHIGHPHVEDIVPLGCRRTLHLGPTCP